MDRLMEVLSKQCCFSISEFSGRAATGYRSSVACRTPTKIGHRLYLKLSQLSHRNNHMLQCLTTSMFWPSTCIVIYVTSQLWSTSNGNQQEDKRAQNSTTEVSFCTIMKCFESVHDCDHNGVVRILVGLSCKLWGFFNYIRLQYIASRYITWHNFFPTRSV